jgi:hypothetical protein
MVGNELSILGIVNVVAKNRNAIAECCGQTIQNGVHCAARSTPRGIEIDQRGRRAGRYLFEFVHIV